MLQRFSKIFKCSSKFFRVSFILQSNPYVELNIYVYIYTYMKDFFTLRLKYTENKNLMKKNGNEIDWTFKNIFFQTYVDIFLNIISEKVKITPVVICYYIRNFSQIW